MKSTKHSSTDLIELIGKLVEHEPMVPSEIDGSLSCYFCGETSSGTEEAHRPACPYLAAKTLLNNQRCNSDPSNLK